VALLRLRAGEKAAANELNAIVRSTAGASCRRILFCYVCYGALRINHSSPREPLAIEKQVLVLPSSIHARILGVARTRLVAKPGTLNKRETEILTWIARGKTSAEVAQKLCLSKRTIEFHIENARLKLGAATRTEAAIKAVASGLINP
jgi:DNA-binding CsgD family transcriptional regulator